MLLASSRECSDWLRSFRVEPTLDGDGSSHIQRSVLHNEKDLCKVVRCFHFKVPDECGSVTKNMIRGSEVMRISPVHVPARIRKGWARLDQV